MHKSDYIYLLLLAFQVTVDYNNIVSTAIVAQIPIGGGADGPAAGGATSAGGFINVAVIGNQLLLIDQGTLRVLDISSRNLTTLCKPGQPLCFTRNTIDRKPNCNVPTYKLMSLQGTLVFLET